MTKKFKVGDTVSWNSEAGRVSGTIIKVHTKDFDYKGIPIAPRKMIRNMKSRATKRITSPLIRARR